MLRMRNGWLQWLQNVQKPLVGLFLHLVWPKTELESLPGSFSQFFVVSARQNTPRLTEPGSRGVSHAKNPTHTLCRTISVPTPYSVEVLVAWVPYGHNPTPNLGPIAFLAHVVVGCGMDTWLGTWSDDHWIGFV
jgi:hypothetical protein